ASARTAVAFMRKVAAAVEYVHRRKVLHRDLKPGNILVDEAGDPLLADFGLAWTDDGHTTTLGGGPFGTPAYMAPEVVRYGPGGCTERSDIWAVGVILYELLAGGRPFVAEKNDTSELYRLIQHVPPPPIRDSAAALPDADERLETIYLKCLAKLPTHRYQSAGELADDLQRWLDGQPPTLGAQPDAPDVRSAAELPPDPPAVAPTVTVVEPKPPARWQPKVAAGFLVSVLLTATALSAVLWPRQQPTIVPDSDRVAIPPPAKKSLVERLDAPGKKVVFIGETRMPVEEVGPLTGFEGRVGVGIGGRCVLNTATSYFHQLASEELPFPVLFEAEVAVGTPVGRTRVGIYALERGHLQPDKHVVHTAYFNCFGPGPRVAGNDQVSQYDEAIAAPGTFAVPDGSMRANSRTMFTPFLTTWKQVKADPIDPNGQPGPFHHLAIEVSGGQIRASRDQAPFGMVCDQDASLLQGILAQYPLTMTSPLLGHGYGVFVIQGVGQFRNVRVTRLADK
ncbi:MAG: serine/threonine-protein kinase, partial [Gemmataceae bacterium]